jgi:hypothetical protein
MQRPAFSCSFVRIGLKIRGPETAVGVQVSLRAPENPLKTRLIDLAFFRALQSTMGIFPYLKEMQRHRFRVALPVYMS